MTTCAARTTHGYHWGERDSQGHDRCGKAARLQRWHRQSRVVALRVRPQGRHGEPLRAVPSQEVERPDGRNHRPGCPGAQPDGLRVKRGGDRVEAGDEVGPERETERDDRKPDRDRPPSTLCQQRDGRIRLESGPKPGGRASQEDEREHGCVGIARDDRLDERRKEQPPPGQVEPPDDPEAQRRVPIDDGRLWWRAVTKRM